MLMTQFSAMASFYFEREIIKARMFVYTCMYIDIAMAQSAMAFASFFTFFCVFITVFRCVRIYACMCRSSATGCRLKPRRMCSCIYRHQCTLYSTLCFIKAIFLHFCTFVYIRV